LKQILHSSEPFNLSAQRTLVNDAPSIKAQSITRGEQRGFMGL